jgi:hypothetical protein
VTNLPPIHREVFVDAEPAVAFDVFTGQIGQWWPLAENGVYGGQSTVAFEEGRLIERSTDGEMSVWGTVTEWAPGQAVRFTWHPGKEAEKASAVSVVSTGAARALWSSSSTAAGRFSPTPKPPGRNTTKAGRRCSGISRTAPRPASPWTRVALMHASG